MPRRSQQGDPEILRRKLIKLLTDFEKNLSRDDLRGQVLALVPVHYNLRDLGASLKGLEPFRDGVRGRGGDFQGAGPGVCSAGKEGALKAPFPWFGGKSRAACRITWSRSQDRWRCCCDGHGKPGRTSAGPDSGGWWATHRWELFGSVQASAGLTEGLRRGETTRGDARPTQ